MIRPVLFSDIDGVAADLLAVVLHPKNTYIPTAIQELNKFCAETSCLVAPITARLRVQSPRHFQHGLREAGFTGMFHPRLAVPRSLRPFSRSADLAKFMEEEHIPLEASIIADDKPRYYTAAQLTRLVQPETAIGFSEANRLQALELLGGSATNGRDYTNALRGWTHDLEGRRAHKILVPEHRPLSRNANPMNAWQDRHDAAFRDALAQDRSR